MRSKILCLQCAEIFSRGKARETICPRCGWTISIAEFDSLYIEARRVLNLGHRYREIYERQVESIGEVRSMACLHEPSHLLVFATIAALSGIIGNASYDAVRAVIRRLSPQNSKSREEFGTLGTDDGIQVFIRHGREFLDGLTEINVTVRRAIEEEERAEISGDLTSRALKKVDMEDSKAVRQAISESIRATAKRIAAGGTSVIDRSQMQRILSDVWNELPD